MKIVVHKVHEKSTSGDYAEFEALRESILEDDAPPAPSLSNRPDQSQDGTRTEMIRLLSILSS
jgi:hypothetical protein